MNYGILEILLQSLSLSDRDQIISDTLSIILNIVENLERKKLKNERVYVLNKMMEFEWLINQIGFHRNSSHQELVLEIWWNLDPDIWRNNRLKAIIVEDIFVEE